MSCNNNTPGNGYIYIENLVITYADNNYAINNIYTNKKYIYFNEKDKNNLYISNKRILKEGYFYIIKNNNGNALMINNNHLKLVFDNFDKKAVSEKIIQVTNDVANTQQSIVTINNNVDTLSDSYKKTKSFNEIKESLNTSIVEYNSLLIELKIALTNFLNDNKFVDEEKSQTNTKLDNINNKSIETLAYADALTDLYCEYSDLDASDIDTTKVYQYKVIIISLLAQLKNDLTQIITSSNIDVEIADIVPITSSITSMINSLSLLKTECNNLVFLGAGGTISDEIYNANVRIDTVVSNFNQLQSSILSSLDEEKKRVQGYFDNMLNYSNKIVDITNTISSNGGKITKAQYSLLTDDIFQMELIFSKVKASYESYVSNEKITNDAKNELTKSFGDFQKNFNDFSKYIKDNCKDLKLSNSDASAMSIALAKYRETRNNLNAKILYCINTINTAVNETTLQQIKDNFQAEIDKVNQNIQSLDERITALENKLN